MEQSSFILVVDDEPNLLNHIGLALETEGFEVLTAFNGAEALEVLRTQPVDLILADIAMPVLNGYQLYERVRGNPEWVMIPFIFLTARTLDSDIDYGKELGADDYLMKPIRAGELIAAVRGRLRRTQQLTNALSNPALSTATTHHRLSVGQLSIEPSKHRVWLEDEEIKLSAREFALLQYLAQQADRMVSTQELVQVTHDLETDNIEAGTLMRPLIFSLRRKLGSSDDGTEFIENVRGVGYRLVTLDG